MSLSTFGGEINPHRNFDLDVCANCGMECVRIQEQVAGGERKRMVGLTLTQQLMVALDGYHQKRSNLFPFRSPFFYHDEACSKKRNTVEERMERV